MADSGWLGADIFPFTIFDCRKRGKAACDRLFVELQGFSFELEKFVFEFYAAWGREAAEVAVASDYAVAGNNQG